MCFAGASQTLDCNLPSARAPFGYTVAFHLGDLCKHGDNQLPDALADDSYAPDIECHAHVHERSDRGLNIKRVAPEPVYGIQFHQIAFTDEVHHRLKAGSIHGFNRAGHPFIDEGLVGSTTKSRPLRLDALLTA
jgi:hypothetical protein